MVRASFLSLLSGSLLLLALPPYDLWWLAWVALVPFLVGLRGKSVKQAVFLGWLTGAAVNYGAFHWLKQLMDQFSNLGPAVYLIMLIMALYQGIPFLVWAVILRSKLNQPSRGRVILAFVVCAMSFPALEFFYPIVFPWYLANTQHIQPNVTGVIELGGCGLLSLAIVVVNLCLARLLITSNIEGTEKRLWPYPIANGSRKYLAVTLLLTFWSCWSFSFVRNKQIQKVQDEAQLLEIGLVQPNHWVKGINPIEALHDYQRLSLELVEKAEKDGKPLDLILWPESAVRTPPSRFLSSRGTSDDYQAVRLPLDLTSVYQGLTRPAPSLEQERGANRWELLAIQRAHKIPVLFGSTLRDWSPEAKGPLPSRPPLYNCGVLIGEAGEVVGIAPKVELLLFGETIPGSSYVPQVYKLLPLASALLPGTGPVVFEFKQARLGMMICYEDLLSGFHYDLAKKKPQILLNLTNDAWFGKTEEAYAHLSLSKLRTIEGRVFLVRSTPSGVSAVVDALGRLVASIPQDTAGTVHYSVALMDVETGFEKWGDSVVWLGLLLTLLHFALGLLKGFCGGIGFDP